MENSWNRLIYSHDLTAGRSALIQRKAWSIPPESLIFYSGVLSALKILFGLKPRKNGLSPNFFAEKLDKNMKKAFLVHGLAEEEKIRLAHKYLRKDNYYMTLMDLKIDNAVLGRALRSYRNRKNITQEQLAERMGYDDPSYLSKLETGKRKISLEWVLRYGLAMGENLNTFVDEILMQAGYPEFMGMFTNIPLYDELSNECKLVAYSHIKSLVQYEKLKSR